MDEFWAKPATQSRQAKLRIGFKGNVFMDFMRVPPDHGMTGELYTPARISLVITLLCRS